MMTSVIQCIRGGLGLILLLSGISCGGNSNRSAAPAPAGASVAAAANVLPVVVDAGPTANMASVNTLFTTVTLCVPGSTTQCQTIDHIQVDTGSYGLRLLAPPLTLALPISAAPNGNSLAECTQFVDGYSWGPIASADIQLAGEMASSVPVQIIGDANFSAVPDDCSSIGPAEDTVAEFGANGILGIGVFGQDCGPRCVSDASIGIYYACPAAGDCMGTKAPLQVENPVPLFAVDNNGTLIDLPAASNPGNTTLTGTLIFGIDTQTNNASGSQIVLTVDSGNGNITTIFNGQTLDMSFIDSGSNAIYFNDSSITQCSDQGFTDFYCPAATQNFSATLTGANGVSATASFSVANAETLATDDPTFAVLPALASTYSASTNTFDFGLPFYYGRRVATAIEGHSTAVNSGPYIAF